ncbi:saxiphilin-like [Hyla sarda]|uniref:saxiphilin-like n=1 Tax=Hyla sarda TaxID=327740 RepID=UPI0024C40AA2|nr:saxiphilin-like [Hyla sarda]
MPKTDNSTVPDCDDMINYDLVPSPSPNPVVSEHGLATNFSFQDMMSISTLDQLCDHNSTALDTVPKITTRNSNFYPVMSRTPVLDMFQEAVERDLTTLAHTKSHHANNLTRLEQAALDSLSTADDLVVRQADKGGAVVILDKGLYRQINLDMLSDPNTYRVLRSDPTSIFKQRLVELVDLGKEKGFFTLREADFLIVEYPIIPIFHSLSKIHKLCFPPPCRPIVAGIGSLSENLCAWIDSLLQPLIPQIPAYIQDTKHLLLNLNHIPWHSSFSWVSADVTSLYSVIPHHLALTALQWFLSTYSTYTLDLREFLGLSYAAPKPRDIRWCVTSDVEIKKCNDLATSCSVNEIALLCVKKSSTEDCMKAISDGEADAISLDNGDVYKASLNPFNLRPIMTESHHSHRVHQGPCHKERQALLGAGRPLLGAFVPECDEKGNYFPKQCHGSTGYCWCVNKEGKEIEGTKTSPGQPLQTCEDSADQIHQGPCHKERQALLGAGRPLLGAFVPECDEKGNYFPKQCHGSTGYCWCVNKEGKEIEGTKTSPGQPLQTCEDSADQKSTPCLRHRQRALGGGKRPMMGAFVPKCDDDGEYVPKQCHGSTGHCWCVNKDGEEIEGSRAGPGKGPVICEDEADNPCLKERQKILGEKTPSVGRFVPQCDEKGNFSPQQCHGSTGYCWCVNVNGEEIAGTKTPPGQPAQNCEAHEPVTCHYALAVVKKSSTFQFDQLKGKRSCHSAIGETAGWIAPMTALLKKNLLLWEGPEEKSFEKAVSEFFLASCAPGAKEENLCKQCAGQEDKCKRSPGELYYGDEGALRCLRDDKGDVAFLEHTALSEQNSEDFELLCPDNIRRPLSQHKDCNFGKVSAHAVVTRSNGDKTKDITEYLLEAQKKQCKLFSSTHGQDLLFEDTTTSLITLPAEMDTFLFLGPEVYNAMHTLHGAPLPSNKEIRWCTQSQNEKLKCDNWSSVSGGAIKCIEPSSVHECIKKILKGEAEAITVSVDYMYTALQCGLVIAVEEYHNKNDFAPCQTRGAKYTDFGTPSAVALVKKSDKDITWNNLKGKKSCHTGVGHQAGWIIPTSLISKETMSCDIGSYFSESCAPGSAIDSNLCKLCIGDPQNTKANTKCSPNNKEAYYDNEGAIRCLAEKGDVAFVPHTAVFENTDGKNPAPWAKDLKSTDFELLCLDGSRAPVSDYRKCDILGVPPRAVITRPETLSDVVRITISQQSLYGRKGFEKDIFQMFSSSNGQNLLFNDGTQCLIEFDRQIEKGILDDYFGKRYHSAVYKDSHCLPISELASACSFHHC